MKHFEILKITIGLVLAGFLATSCASEKDPAASWLLALANPDAPQDMDQTVSTKEPTAEEPITGEFQLDTNVYYGEEDFIFDTTQDISVDVTVVSPFDPIGGATVRVYDVDNPNDMTYFSAVTSDEGKTTGTFTIDPNTDVVTLSVNYMGETFVRDFNVDYVKNLVVRIIIRGDLTEPVVAEPDADGDGIPDSLDAYPDDPERAATVKYPSNGEYFTIAYEDLYPVPGDMDFNDYVIRANFEEDLNSKGEVVRIRAHYVHVARGAGYKHTLHLKVPGAPDMDYHLIRTKSNGQLALDESGVIAEGGNLEILPKSLSTIPSSNTSAQSEQAFNLGWSADVEMIMSTPISTDKIVRVPYDTYLYVLNTNKEVHFAGIYDDPNAGWFDNTAMETDLYVDENGFPWALLVPGDWHWPYERGDIHRAYEFFDDWYTSAGKNAQDWYLTPTEGKVFNY